jgi:hypothetical protein
MHQQALGLTKLDPIQLAEIGKFRTAGWIQKK